jgi:hypothetical protein
VRREEGVQRVTIKVKRRRLRHGRDSHHENMWKMNNKYQEDVNVMCYDAAMVCG